MLLICFLFVKAKVVLFLFFIPHSDVHFNIFEPGRRAICILNNLFVNYSAILPGITLLDPLPQDPVFRHMSLKYQEIRYKTLIDHLLENEIKHFIEADIQNHLCTYRVEGLRSLRIQVWYIFEAKK